MSQRNLTAVTWYDIMKPVWWTRVVCCCCPLTTPLHQDVIPDAVDEVIETVLNKGGEVVFTENGQLDTYQRIALVLRY